MAPAPFAVLQNRLAGHILSILKKTLDDGGKTSLLFPSYIVEADARKMFTADHSRQMAKIVKHFRRCSPGAFHSRVRLVECVQRTAFSRLKTAIISFIPIPLARDDESNARQIVPERSFV